MANIFYDLVTMLRPKKQYTVSRRTAEPVPWELPNVKENSASQDRGMERTHTKVEKEDFLLSQIDEFREKAKQLQDLLASKESKAQELHPRQRLCISTGSAFTPSAKASAFTAGEAGMACME